MSLAVRFRKSVVGTARALEFVAGVIVLIVAVAVTVNAIARYGFGRDLAIITEAGGFVFLVVTFLALAGTYLVGQHVAVEMLELVGSRRFVDRMYNVIIPAVSLVFMLALTVTTLLMTLRYYHNGRVTLGMYAMPFWVFMAVVPLGSFLMSLAIVSDLIERFRGAQPSTADHDGDAPADDGL